MKLEALLFDVDGTLVDTEELHRQAFNQAFLEFELDWDWGPALYIDLLAVSGGVHRIAHYIDTLGLPPAEKVRLRRLIPAIHRAKTHNVGHIDAYTSCVISLTHGRMRATYIGNKSFRAPEWANHIGASHVTQIRNAHPGVPQHRAQRVGPVQYAGNEWL